jgi:hypothetical protein
MGQDRHLYLSRDFEGGKSEFKREGNIPNINTEITIQIHYSIVSIVTHSLEKK